MIIVNVTRDRDGSLLCSLHVSSPGSETAVVCRYRADAPSDAGFYEALAIAIEWLRTVLPGSS